MAHAINPNSMSLADWQKYNSDVDVEYKIHEPDPTAITFNTGSTHDEMIRIDKDGFYVRGVKVPADAQEAKTVYNAFKQWLAWANLQQQR